jgi:hypothetical protein
VPLDLTGFQENVERACRQFSSIKAPKYAVLVGVDVQPNQRIAKAVNEDCEDLEMVLCDCGFSIHAILERADATKVNVMKAVADMKALALASYTADPTLTPVVLFVYAGHGVVDTGVQKLCTATENQVLR